MSSLHKSQDGLFYSTTALDSNQLWTFGYACKTCRFVQMGEDRLKRHVESSVNCHEYAKVNIISIIHEPSSSSATQIGIFMCPALEQVCLEPSKVPDIDKELSQPLSLLPGDLVESLAERLTAPVEEESSSPSSPSQKCEDAQRTTKGPPAGPIPSTSSLDQRASQAAPVQRKRSNELSEDEDAMQICEDTRISDDGISIDGKLLPKPNTFLGTTISKLADMLGTNPSIDAEPSADVSFSSSQGDSEGDLQMDVDDEEESQLSEDDSWEESEDSSEAGTEDDNQETALKEADLSTCSFLRIENVVSLNDDDANNEGDSLNLGSAIPLHSNVTLRKDEVTFPFSIQHIRPEFAVWLKDAQTYKQMIDRSRNRNLFKCMAYHCIFACDSMKDFVQVIFFPRSTAYYFSSV